MIRLGLVGLADPRHDWFLAARQRRRAGIRVVGASEADPDALASATLGELPVYQDHRTLLATARPDLVAVTRHLGGSTAIIEALQCDADVVAVPPVADHPEELDAIVAAATSSGRRCLVANTLRGQPAALLARELLADERLGSLEVVTLIVPDDCNPEDQQSLTSDVLDLFCWLTGGTQGTISAIADGHSARDDDPPEFVAGYGKLIMIATTTVNGSEIVCEVRRRSTPSDWPVTVQVGGSTGAVEWDFRSGMLRSVLADTEPRLISTGRINHAEWILNNLLRKQSPEVSTTQSLAISRMLLLLAQSAANGGTAENWRS